MKKIKSLFKKNVKLVIGIIIGGVVFGTLGVYAATVIASSQVGYDNTNSGIQATNVQDAIDELYTKANTPAAPTTITAPGGTVFAMVTGTKGYACNSNIIGKLLCVRNGPKNDTNDYNARKAELEKACTAVGGSFSSSRAYALCSSGDFDCSVLSYGSANCNDNSSNHNCNVNTDGSVNCN